MRVIAYNLNRSQSMRHIIIFSSLLLNSFIGLSGTMTCAAIPKFRKSSKRTFSSIFSHDGTRFWNLKKCWMQRKYKRYIWINIFESVTSDNCYSGRCKWAEYWWWSSSCCVTNLGRFIVRHRHQLRPHRIFKYDLRNTTGKQYNDSWTWSY